MSKTIENSVDEWAVCASLIGCHEVILQALSSTEEIRAIQVYNNVGFKLAEAMREVFLLLPDVTGDNQQHP